MRILIHCGAFAADLRQAVVRDHGLPKPPLQKVAPQDPAGQYGDYVMHLPDEVAMFVLLQAAPTVCRVPEDAADAP